MADTIDASENMSKDQQASTSSAQGDDGLLKALWGFFGSMKTAISLLLILAAVSILGTVIEQNPMSTPNPVLRALDLTNVYHSHWYGFLLTLIGINLVVCSIKRLKMTWRQLHHPKVLMEHSAIAGMQRSQKFSGSGSVESAARQVHSALHKGSYRVIEEQAGEDRVIYAAKGRISLWGPYLTHVSLLTIFAGAIVGNILGFHGYVTIPEGQSVRTYYPDGSDHEANLGFRVLLKRFEVKRDSAGNPTAFNSSLEVYSGDKLVGKKTIDVNRPLTYQGVSFFQSDYGVAGMVIRLTAPNGDVASVPFDVQTGSGPGGKQFTVAEPFKEVKLAGKKFTLYVHDLGSEPGEQTMMASAPTDLAASMMINDRFPEYKGLDAWTSLGYLQAGNAADYKGFKVSLDRIVDYSGLQVSKNPGLPVVYIGFGLLMLGVLLSFYVVRSVMRVRISQSANGVTITAGATSRGEPSVSDRDFIRLQEALGSQPG